MLLKTVPEVKMFMRHLFSRMMLFIGVTLYARLAPSFLEYIREHGRPGQTASHRNPI